MTFSQRIATIFLALQAAHSYILLTANLDDVQAIYKQITASPVAGQIEKILRRASNIFKQQVKKPTTQKRTNGDLDSDEKEYHDRRSRIEKSPENTEDDISEMSAQSNDIQRRAQDEDDLSSLGKNASYYLSSIQKIMETVK